MADVPRVAGRIRKAGLLLLLCCRRRHRRPRAQIPLPQNGPLLAARRSAAALRCASIPPAVWLLSADKRDTPARCHGLPFPFLSAGTCLRPLHLVFREVSGRGRIGLIDRAAGAADKIRTKIGGGGLRALAAACLTPSASSAGARGSRASVMSFNFREPLNAIQSDVANKVAVVGTAGAPSPQL